MPIIDADVHISPTPQQGCSITAEELIQRMDRSGVERAVTWIHPPYERGWLDDSLEYLYRSSLKYPQRIIGFGWADPNLGIDRARDTIKRCVEEYGFAGVKLNGAQNYFNLGSPEVQPLIEEIARAGVVAGFHIGADSYENTHPYRLIPIAQRYPEMPILMIHMGGASFEDLSQSAIEVAAQCPNITLVGSAVRSRSVLKAVQALGADRICFGSDSPFEIMWVEVAKYRALLEQELNSEDYHKIMYGNAEKLFH